MPPFISLHKAASGASDGWHYYWLWTSTDKVPAAVYHELVSMLIQIGIA